MPSMMTGTRRLDYIKVYDPSKPMTTAQVADFLGFTPRYVYQLVEQGRLPAIKVGRTLFFSPKKIYELAGMADYLPKETVLI